ncbi:MAG: DinB family protein [Longimicrobiales bacterium]
MSRFEELRDLIAYTEWANARVLDAAAALEPEAFSRYLGSSFPSVRATLAHMVGSEWIWLRRWTGISPAHPPDDWDLSNLDSIRAHWADVETERAAFLDRLGEANVSRMIKYRTTKRELFSQPLDRLIRHVVNHATYHRGQVVTMLRQLGASAPATDFVLYDRMRGTG